jgi:hypothetical protein
LRQEYEKGKMPDKYKDLMEPKDVQALAGLVGWLQERFGQYAEADQDEVSIMQPKLKSKVRCTDGEVGEVRRVIMDPLSHEISHIVVGVGAADSVERQVPMGQVHGVTDEVVTLRGTSAEYAARCRVLTVTSM